LGCRGITEPRYRRAEPVRMIALGIRLRGYLRKHHARGDRSLPHSGVCSYQDRPGLQAFHNYVLLRILGSHRFVQPAESISIRGASPSNEYHFRFRR
jgi:hypothetical protein